MSKAAKPPRGEYEPDWADEPEEEKKTRKETAKMFGPQKDPEWWDINTFSKVCGEEMVKIHKKNERKI